MMVKVNRQDLRGWSRGWSQLLSSVVGLLWAKISSWALQGYISEALALLTL
jgi:hypothetical protein